MKEDVKTSIVSNERIAECIEEAEAELARIKPEIDYLEECQKKLRGLKEQQFKLNSLIISLKGVVKISNVNVNNNEVLITNNIEKQDNVVLDNVLDNDNTNNDTRKIFMPDQAISQVKNYLRTKNNLNYEIYKAVVFNSGFATTQEIKNYLVENNIKQPKSGKGFEHVELKEISSRANYLVRKKILSSLEPGHFRSVFGWCEIES